MSGPESGTTGGDWGEGRDRRGRGGSGGAASDDAVIGPGYYGIPAIHKPHWKWLIIFYFYFGGIAGAAYAVATIADAVGASEDRRIGRIGRYLSFAALLPSPILLVLDLGRPERFFLMFRVLKLRSPMSLGTWGLTAFGGFSALSVAAQAAVDGRLGDGFVGRRAQQLPIQALGVAGTPLALFVAGYTGVLLAATAVPLWTKRALLLGPLFLASAFSSAVSAIELIVALMPSTPAATRHRLTRLGVSTLFAEAAIFIAWRNGLGPTGRPLGEGATGRVVRLGVVGGGIALPLVLQAVASVTTGGFARILSVVSSVSVLAGGLALRYVVVVAGNTSADDPRATLGMTAADGAPERLSTH
ncbi:MAG: Formate dehydrogenase O putative subunit [uncultured Thermomicrobiales bacterium]|uniref:Formate dehydrogenase O putative subunit n=1 Tax=uncultured Thermomicrobiales bacterium TaxID=1645740 RepID=A0A6J4UAA3_9BACT|nr:MAG: Formate dehydrogenase O putative subunit [uncultured Thermomicrobiales bacterium]